jgi:hypothetical protein
MKTPGASNLEISSILGVVYGRASGGFSVSLNLGQFASSVAIAPPAAFALTDHSIFLVFGCAAFVLVLPYLLVTTRGGTRAPKDPGR